MLTDDVIGFTPDLHLGIGDIDREHRELFRLLYKLGQQPERNTNSEAFCEIVTQIGNELYEHFRAEELYFRNGVLSAVEADAHKHAHDAIIMQLVDLNMALMIGNPPEYDHTMRRITDWVISHVKTFDMKLRLAT